MTGEARAAVDFNREVRPILSDKCFHCHGPDEAKRKAKLRLDTREGLLRAQKPIVIAGKAAQSELFKRLVTKSADDLMPPAKAKKPLTAAQIEYAIMLFNGDGIAKDEAAAARLFMKAAKTGNPIAANRLAASIARCCANAPASFRYSAERSTGSSLGINPRSTASIGSMISAA